METGGATVVELSSCSSGGGFKRRCRKMKHARGVNKESIAVSGTGIIDSPGGSRYKSQWSVILSFHYKVF